MMNFSNLEVESDSVTRYIEVIKVADAQGR